MAGIRKTIYVPDENVWDLIVERAGEAGKSVSQYLIEGVIWPSKRSVFEVVDEKLDLILERLEAGRGGDRSGVSGGYSLGDWKPPKGGK